MWIYLTLLNYIPSDTFYVMCVLSWSLFFFKIYFYLFILTAPGLSCGMRDLVPRPGTESWPPALGAQSLTHWTTREVPIMIFKKKVLGLPWWCSGWESACQCRGHGFKPWSGKIPHATEQLGLWATATEPARLEPVLRNKRGRDSERPVHGDEEWPPLAAARESPRTETKTQHSQK